MISAGNDAICVAVIDSGWDRAIDEPRVRAGIGLVNPADELRLQRNDDDQDRIGHGTCCADLVLRVAPTATILPIKVFGSRLETSPHMLIAAIRLAADAGARVINLSLGTQRRDARDDLYAACEYARRRGAILVAAGVYGTRKGGFPAAFDPVIGVGPASVDTPFAIRYHAGESLECGARVAGQRARSLGGFEVEVAGTSVAAPVVSGHVVRLLQEDPLLDLDGIRGRLEVMSSPS
jgi:subtilisin family serine protease